MQNPVVHFEIPADNVDRAKSFYSKAFGWDMVAPPGMDYLMVGTTAVGKDQRPTTPGAINGGMLKRQEPVRQVVITISVDNIDASIKQITKLGGKAVGTKVAVGDMGWAAYFSDTEGNVVGLWQTSKR